MLTIFASMKWQRVGPDSLTLGFLVYPFLWNVCYEEATNALNIWAQFIHGVGTAVSDANAQAMLKVVANPPLEGKSIDSLKRMEIVTSVLLPKGHGFLSHIQDHIIRFNDNEQKC